jgi:NAD(P)-dependent dehydrogenase (short-subunit alcohol dehydrogenase family)
MARVLIIGASKGIGLDTTRQALEAGHHVRAFARSADRISLSSSKLEKMPADALESKDVEAGLSRSSISCLQRIPFQLVFGRAYEDKSLQERLIKESLLECPRKFDH